ncbi:MAG: hypothetical protein ABJF04_01850 [Reichenbachiella sp.]|uniref:hypothetical protein n=1 Tax=Reichenbachiella sp. TaxID=2184521 RepID=UPI00326354DF
MKKAITIAMTFTLILMIISSKICADRFFPVAIPQSEVTSEIEFIHTRESINQNSQLSRKTVTSHQALRKAYNPIQSITWNQAANKSKLCTYARFIRFCSLQI